MSKHIWKQYRPYNRQVITRDNLGICFNGSATKLIEIPRIKRDLRIVNEELEAVAEVRRLLPLGLTNQEIADTLNEKDFKRGTQAFSPHNINDLISRYDLPKRSEIVRSGETEKWLTAKEKMEELGIGKNKLRRMRIVGKLVARPAFGHRNNYLYKPEVAADVVTR